MGRLKEALLNNIPFNERFEDYGRTGNLISKTRITFTPKYTETSSWDSTTNTYKRFRVDKD
jgi:hypothetical protein